MQMCMLTKERDKRSRQGLMRYRRKTDSCLSSLLNAVLWNCLNCVGRGRKPSARKKLGRCDFQESSGQGKSHFQDVLSKCKTEDSNL